MTCSYAFSFVAWPIPLWFCISRNRGPTFRPSPAGWSSTTGVALDCALDTLPAAVRQAFLWAQLEGLTCPQIAKRLGVSLATAERYVAKGLRRCYEQRFGS